MLETPHAPFHLESRADDIFPEPTMTSKTATRLLYLALTLFIACSLTHWVAQSTGLVERLVHTKDHIRLPFSVDDDLLTLSALTPEAQAAGLRAGDRLLELRGKPYRNREQLVELTGGGAQHLQPGDPLDLTVDRGQGNLQHVRIRTVAPAYVPHPIAPVLVWISAVFPLACLLIGYWVTLARIRDPYAWLLLVLFSFPSVLSDGPNWWPGFWFYLQFVWWQGMQLLAAPALLVFGLYFPERWRVDKRLPWAKWLLLGPLAAGVLLAVAVLLMQMADAPRLGGTTAWLGQWVSLTVNALNLACVIAYAVILVDKLRSATTADARRRMQVLTTGSFVGSRRFFPSLCCCRDSAFRHSGTPHLRSSALSCSSPRPFLSPMSCSCSARSMSASCCAWARSTPLPEPP